MDSIESFERNTGDDMAHTHDTQLNNDFQMIWMDGTEGFETISPIDLALAGPADVDDEEDDLEDDEDLDEDDEEDEDDDLEDDLDQEDEDDEEDDLDDEDEYDDDDEDDDEEEEDDEE